MRTFRGVSALLSLPVDAFSRRYFRPVKLPKDRSPDKTGYADGGAHMDEAGDEGSMSFQKMLRLDLNVSLNPTAPPTASEAQIKMQTITSSYNPSVWAYRTFDATEMVILMKRTDLFADARTTREKAEVASMVMSVPRTSATDLTLTEKLGPDRWRPLSLALATRLESMDAAGVSPIVRRLKEMKLNVDVWKPFLRSVMMGCLHERYLRRQLADVIMGIRFGMTPVSLPLEGTYEKRSTDLAMMLLAAAREAGDMSITAFCVDLLHEAGVSVSYSLQKELMYINFADRRKWMDVNLRESGELRVMVPYLLTKYLPKVDGDRNRGGLTMPTESSRLLGEDDETLDSRRVQAIPTLSELQEPEKNDEEVLESEEDEEEREEAKALSPFAEKGTGAADYFSEESVNQQRYHTSQIHRVMSMETDFNEMVTPALRYRPDAPRVSSARVGASSYQPGGFDTGANGEDKMRKRKGRALGLAKVSGAQTSFVPSSS